MLMAFWEVQRLTREIHQLEYRAITVRNKLERYQKYAGVLGGSTTNPLHAASVAGLPPELRTRATIFSQFANQASSMSAMQNVQMMKMSGLVPWTGNALTQYQIEMSAFARFKEESLKALKQQEVNILAEREKELELEMNTIETRLKEKRAMLESAKNLLDNGIKESVPKFGL